MGNENSNRGTETTTHVMRGVHIRSAQGITAPTTSSVPQSERDIIDLLKLDEHAVAHPAPEKGSKIERVVVFNGITYTRAAVKAALETLDDATLSNLLKYPHLILSHNNLGGNQSGGGNDTIEQFLLTTASQPIEEKLFALLNDQPENQPNQ